MKKILMLFAALTTMVLVSCTNDPSKEPVAPIVPEDGFLLNVKVPGIEASTYANVESVKGENEINSLWLLFFEKSARKDGKYVGAYLAHDPANTTPMNLADPIAVKFPAGSGLNASDAYNILVVANMFHYIQGDYTTPEDYFNSLNGLTQEQVMEQAEISVSGIEFGSEVWTGGYDAPIPDMQIPMSAMLVKEARQENMSAELLRSVARIDVVNKLKASYDLVSASIWNAYPEGNVFEGVNNTFSQTIIQRFYGIRAPYEEDPASPDPDDPDYIYSDIKGGLYAFENYVGNPGARDEKTTCVIIGLIDKSDVSATIQYFRANIHPKDMSQNLKRNNVYSVAIKNIKGEGKGSEYDAFTSDDQNLEVTINNWVVDEEGLIQFDGDNVLVIPTKKVYLSALGEERDLSIFTIGDMELYVSKSSMDNGLRYELVGKNLKLIADPLPVDLDERKGSVELTFGSLKATIDIVQSAASDHYLELSQYSISSFPASLGVGMLNPIMVNASGAWKAEVFNPTSPEAFTLQAGLPKFTIDSSEAITGGFNIYTYSANDSKTTSRRSFIIVSLVDYPEINRSVVLTQRAAAGITVVEAIQNGGSVNRLAFDASTTVNSANATNEFTVHPGENGDDSNPLLNGWIVNITGDNADKFSVINENHDTALGTGGVLGSNSFEIVPTEINGTTGSYTATAVVSIVGQPQVTHNITLVQNPYGLTLNPNAISATVAATGGMTQAVTVNGDAGSKWSATITTNTDAQGHSAYFYNDANDTSVKTITSADMGSTFRIVFPNLTVAQTEPVATVTITVDGSTVSTTITAKQSTLIPKAIRWQSTYRWYGSWAARYTAGTNATYLSYYYYGRYPVDYLMTPSYFGSTSALVPTGDISYSTTYSNTIGAGVNLVNVVRAGESSSGANTVYNWHASSKSNWAFVLMNGSYTYGTRFFTNFLSKYGYSRGLTEAQSVIQAADIRKIDATSAAATNGVQKKVMDYLLKDGPFTKGLAPIDVTSFDAATNVRYYNMVSRNGLPSSAVSIITDPTGTKTVAFIDLKNRIFYCTESLLFGRYNNYGVALAAAGTAPADMGPRSRMVGNIMALIANSIQYGEAFTDQFYE